MKSSFKVVRFISALMCVEIIFILLLRRSSFYKLGKFLQKSPSTSCILLSCKSSTSSLSKVSGTNFNGSGTATIYLSFRISSCLFVIFSRSFSAYCSNCFICLLLFCWSMSDHWVWLTLTDSFTGSWTNCVCSSKI